MKMLIATAFAVLTTTGCTTIAYNGGGVETIKIDHPPIGEVNTVYIGDEMLSKGSRNSVNAIELLQPVSVGIIGAYTFSPGIYTQIGQDGDKIFYRPIHPGMVQKNPLADPYQGMYANDNTRKICGISVLGGTVCNDANFKKTKHTSTEMDSFQQTLLYSGRVGNKISISYREFSNDRARPAFTNEAEYDISESKIIGYKGAMIEIISANNSSIKYKVLRNFR